MTFCGYNDTMAQGLRQFVEGMIEAMLDRHSQGVSMSEVLRTELIDLRAMNDALKANRDPGDLLNGLTAINTFADTIFSRAVHETIAPETFAASCRKSAEEFIALVKTTEEAHLKELSERKTRHGDRRAIEAVSEWLKSGRVSAKEPA